MGLHTTCSLLKALAPLPMIGGGIIACLILAVFFTSKHGSTLCSAASVVVIVVAACAAFRWNQLRNPVQEHDYKAALAFAASDPVRLEYLQLKLRLGERHDLRLTYRDLVEDSAELQADLAKLKTLDSAGQPPELLSQPKQADFRPLGKTRR